MPACRYPYVRGGMVVTSLFQLDPSLANQQNQSQFIHWHFFQFFSGGNHGIFPPFDEIIIELGVSLELFLQHIKLVEELFLLDN